MIHTWKKYKLSEIGSVVGGATPSTTIDAYYNGDIPWLTPKDLSNFHERYIERGERNITKSGLNSCSAQLLPAGSVLFSSRAPIGYVAIAKNPIATNQGFKSIIPNPEKVDSLFLYYLLKYNKDNIEAMGSGTTFKEVSGATMKNIEVYLPEDLEEQRRIAGILGSLDDKIELNRRINANLEAQAQALFRSWFVDFEPFRDGPFVDSELGKIPQGWKVVELQTLVTIKRGGSPRPIQNFLSDSGYNWLKISDATSEQSPYIYDIKEHIKESGLNKTVYIKSGELVLSNSATPGIPKMLGVDSCIHDGWLYFPKSALSNEFLYLLFKENREKFLSQGNGSVFLNLKTDILKSFKIIIPNNLDELKEFNIILHNIFQEIKYKTEEIKTLSTLRDTLLPKLMAGEIKI